MASEFADELAAFFKEKMADPVFAAAYAQEQERQKYLDERPCSEGNCVELIDRRTGENVGGWGPALCPCQDGQ